MTSASDEKWRLFNCFFSRVGLRTYQHPCIAEEVFGMVTSAELWMRSLLRQCRLQNVSALELGIFIFGFRRRAAEFWFCNWQRNSNLGNTFFLFRFRRLLASSCMSVRPPFCPDETITFQLIITGVTLYWEFSKTVSRHKILIRILQNIGKYS